MTLRGKDVRRVDVAGTPLTQIAVHHAETRLDGRKRTKAPRRSVRIITVAEPFGTRFWELASAVQPDERIYGRSLSGINRSWRSMWEPVTSKHAPRSTAIKGAMVGPDGEPPVPYLPLGRMRHTNETLMQQAGVLDSLNAAMHGHSQKVAYEHYLHPDTTGAAVRMGELFVLDGGLTARAACV